MFKWIRLLSTCGPSVLKAYFSWIRKYAKHPEKYPLEVRYAAVRKLILFFMKHMRVDLDLVEDPAWKERESVSLIVSNHLSMMDVLMMIAVSEKPVSFVAKIETKKLPFVGKIIQSIDGVFLDRGNLRQNVIAMKTVEDRLKSGYCSYVIYPEGTRQKHPRENMLPMHPGSFKTGVKAGVPLQPMAEYGTFRVFGSRHDYKANPIALHFLKPVLPEDYKEIATPDLAIKIQDMIQKEVNVLRDKDDAYFLANKHHQKIQPPYWWEHI